MFFHHRAAVFLLTLTPSLVIGQGAETSMSRNTVTVTVHESVRVDANLAVVNLGCRSIAPERAAAYEESVRLSNRILASILDAGVPRESVETVEVRLRRIVQNHRDGSNTVEYHANQQWKVRVKPPHAQLVVDRAVAAGANDIGDVIWTVDNPAVLQDQARRAALERARSVAEDIARRLGRQLGTLLYASNEKPAKEGGSVGGLATGAFRSPTEATDLLLLPRKVSEEATIFAIFALK